MNFYTHAVTRSMNKVLTIAGFGYHPTRCIINHTCRNPRTCRSHCSLYCRFNHSVYFMVTRGRLTQRCHARNVTGVTLHATPDIHHNCIAIG